MNSEHISIFVNQTRHISRLGRLVRPSPLTILFKIFLPLQAQADCCLYAAQPQAVIMKCADSRQSRFCSALPCSGQEPFVLT